MEVQISTLRHNSTGYGYARQKISMKYFFSKCDQIRSFLKKLMEISAFIWVGNSINPFKYAIGMLE